MSRPKTINQPVEEEKQAQAEAEILPQLSTEASLDASAKNTDENAEVETSVEEAADLDQVIPAEIAAIHVGNESAAELNKAGPGSIEKSKLERKKSAKASRLATKSEKVASSVKRSLAGGASKSRHSKRLLAAKAKIELGKLYQLPEAISLIKELSISKFDGSVEIHLRLNKKKTKGSTESTRGIITLPHGTGKDRKIVVLNEKIIDEIAKTKKINFDIAIASPELMPKVAKIAKILGPRGLMPDPKSGTVSNDPDKVIAEIKGGKTEYKVDASGIIHQIVGRVSWEEAKLAENAKAVLALYPKSRVNSAFMTASIAPSIPLDLNKL